MRHKPVWSAFGAHLFRRLAEGKRLSLRKHVGEQHVVMRSERVESPSEGNKVAGDEPRALMDELVERVLPVGAGLAPVNGARFVIHARALESYVLAVALHGELLQVSRETLEVLLVGQNGNGVRIEKVDIPDGEQAQQHRQISVERRGPEVLVDFVETGQHGAEFFRSTAIIVERPIAESIE